jgi:hypothetical protein
MVGRGRDPLGATKGMAETTVTESVERRLAAILAADVFGYSRLMGAQHRQNMGKKILRRIFGKGGNESRGLLILLILQILTPMA